jgi:hypothetical protein
MTIVPEEITPTALVTDAHPPMGGRSCQALLPPFTALFFHSRIQGEDVPIRVTDIKGALAPWLGPQLLDYVDLQPTQPGVLPVHIRDFQLNQDPVIGRASYSTKPVLCTFGLAPQGEGPRLQGEFHIVAALDLWLDLQYLLIERAHRLKISGDDRDEGELHATFPFPER